MDEESIKSEDETLHPFYFSPVEGAPYPSGIVLIHPDEEGVQPLPVEWRVDWKQARVLFDRKSGEVA